MIIKKSILPSKLHKNMPTDDFCYVHALPALTQASGPRMRMYSLKPCNVATGKKNQG